MLVRIRSRPDSAHFDARRLSTKSATQSLFKSRFGHVVSSSKGYLPCCRRFLALAISSSWTKLQTHPSPLKRSQLRFRRFLGQSTTEVRFAVTPPKNRILTFPEFPSSQWLSVFPPSQAVQMLLTSSHRLPSHLSPRHHQRAVPSHPHDQDSQEIQETLPFAIA